MRLAWFRQIKTQSTLIACVFVSLGSVAPSRSAAEIPWRTELTTAHAEAKAQNKLLLLHFYSDNCVWCDRLEAGAFQSPQLASALAQGFVPVKIHAGKSPELAKMFNVAKFPTDVVVTTTGQSLTHSVSPQDPNRYIAMLAQAAAQTSSVAPSLPPAMPPQGPPNPAAQPGETQNQLVSAPTGPAQEIPAQGAQHPGMPVNASGQFAMQQMPGGATARLAGVRTDSMTLGTPGQLAGPEPTMANPDVDISTDPSKPKLAMEGYCAVTVIDEDKWIEGNPKFGVVHLGKLYLFSSAAKMDSFLADPVPYTPVLNEIDVVRFFEERQIVPGKRRFGMRDPIHQRMFFFADEAAMNHFFNEYERYTDAAIDVMQRAVRDANPDAT